MSKILTDENETPTWKRTMFNEIKRITKTDECGQVITRLCKLNEKYRVEQVDTYWNRVEEDDAYSLEEAEAMFAEWSR